MQAVKWLAALLPLLVALGACTTTGFGVGEMTGGDAASQQVKFHWSSTNGGISGQLAATVTDSTYRGQFFQITQQMRNEVWQPQWPQAYGGWNFYPYPGLYSYPITQLSTLFTGTVLATLMTQHDQTMRCQFQLVDPASGMSAGGEGSCDLPNGRVVRAVLVGR